MLVYWKGFSGVRLLGKIHGSAMYRSSFPGALSVCIYLLLVHYNIFPDELEDPYPIGVLVSGVVLILIFRANHGYQRYWEACGSVQQMTSKWLDAAVHTATFHMQCAHYDSVKPLSTMERMEDAPGHNYNEGKDGHKRNGPNRQYSSGVLSINGHGSLNTNMAGRKLPSQRKIDRNSFDLMNDYEDTLLNSTPSTTSGRLDGGWGLLFGKNNYDQSISPTASWASGVTPSLFLQELAHLSSLCVAVAFCSLRSNLYDTETPMGPYIPRNRLPFPNVNSSKLYYSNSNDSFFSKCKVWIVYWFGMERTSYYHKIHMECPMLVLGGVSESERKFLSQARGGAAKTTLVWYWLNEFIIREHLEGSMGAVESPIISRINQFLSDGMIGYNNARKISFMPYPFSHAQINAFFLLCLIVFIPLIMQQFTNTMWVGITLVFFTVSIFVGVQEVAGGLENPFINFPNDIPLRTLLGMYNEALIQMCTGYHPDMTFERMKKD